MSARLKPFAAWFGRHFKTIALVGTVAGIAIALYGQREAILAFDWRISSFWILGSILLFAIPPIVQGVSFWMILRALGLESRFDEALLIWMRSFLLRYAPSGALALVIRVRERERFGASTAHVWTATGYEQLVALASGAVVCLAGFLATGAWPPVIAILVAVPALAVAVLLRPGYLGRWLQALLGRRGIEIPALLRGRTLAAVIALNALGWIATGAATWMLIHSVSPQPTPEVAWLVGAYALAWMLGFLVPLLPGGLGLREGTLIAFLAGRFGAGVATALALALRLANTLGEFVAIGGTEVAYLVWKRLHPRASEMWPELRRAEAAGASPLGARGPARTRGGRAGGRGGGFGE